MKNRKFPEGLVIHVGGHKNKTWTDQGALASIVNRYPKAKTFIDIGCGPGAQVKVAKSLGLRAVGVDGDPKMAKLGHVELIDFSKTKVEKSELRFLPKREYFDIGWSTEFLEHIDAEYIENFMPLFALCRVVVITHATPGQGGYHHVNEQLFEYWEEIFDRHGLVHSEELTDLIRSNSTMNKKKLNHFKGFDKDGVPQVEKRLSSFMIKTGRVFVNTKLKEL